MTGNPDTWKLLREAALNSAEELRDFLDTHGDAHVHARDRDDRTVLFWAARGGKVAMTALLIERGADVNAIDRQGDTPLLHCLQNPPMSQSMISFLIRHGADLHIVNDKGHGLRHFMADKTMHKGLHDKLKAALIEDSLRVIQKGVTAEIPLPQPELKFKKSRGGKTP